jgi:hypothetical protein
MISPVGLPGVVRIVRIPARNVWRALGGLVQVLRRKRPRLGVRRRFLEYMAEHDTATFDELREHVWGGYRADDETILKTLRRARELIEPYHLDVRFRVSGTRVFRIDRQD